MDKAAQRAPRKLQLDGIDLVRAVHEAIDESRGSTPAVA